MKEARIELKKRLDEKISKLKNLCNDSHHASKLINDILSIKGQIDIEPTLIHIPVDSIERDESGDKLEFDFGHFKITRTKKGIVLSFNGYKIIVSPWINSLYGQLDMFLRYKKEYEGLSEEEKSNYDCLLNATMTIMMFPMTCFSDDNFWIDAATEITRRQNDLFEKLLKSPLPDEDDTANENFRSEVLFAESLKSDLKKKEENPFDNW